MHKLASSFLFTLFAALAVIFGLDLDIPTEPVAAKEHVVVTHVVDGDTIDVLDGSVSKRIRIIGIDTPERGECYFAEAKAFLEELILDKEVIMLSDPSQANKDRYNRFLRHISLPSGESIAAQIIEGGYGYEYTYDKPYGGQGLYKELASEAKFLQKGLYECN